MENNHLTKEEQFNQEESSINNAMDAEINATYKSITVLPHKITSTNEVSDMGIVLGYTRCMADILDVLNMDGHFWIDKALIRQIIYATNKEISELKNKDAIQTELNSLTKSTNS